MIGNAPKSPHTGLPGWMTDAEEDLLTRYAAQLEAPGVIVEIGGGRGRSAGAFARGAKRGVSIFTIDLFPGERLFEYLQNLSEAGLAGATVPWKGTSADGARWWGEENEAEINLLFVDGDHTYGGVTADIDAWTPHMAVGGVVIFHDVAQPSNKQPHALHHEVARAIGAWTGSQDDFEAVEQVDTIAVYRRVRKPGVSHKAEDAKPQADDDFDADEMAVYEAMSKSELSDFAAELGVGVRSKATKGDLIDAIRKALQG